jgi:rare lipoprotein A
MACLLFLTFVFWLSRLAGLFSFFPIMNRNGMPSSVRGMSAAFSLLLLAGCGAMRAPAPAPSGQTVRVPPSAGVYKVGDPYQIGGIWYYPHEQPDYDETGIASWYGPDFYGKSTANGEVYDGGALTAAHRTLPMPVNVRVTNLENGKSIVVRVNDRGPYARGRIIDLSRHAAELLDVVRSGTARVRVTYLGRADLDGTPVKTETPPEIANALPAVPTDEVDIATLNALKGAAMAPPVEVKELPAPVPESSVALAATEPTGKVDEVPVPSSTHLYVQVGAFSRLENAQRLARSIGGDMRVSALQRGGQTLYRVRTGPLTSVQDADAALARISGAGSGEAEIVVDQ